MSDDVRPITANELRPFFTAEGQVHFDLALSRFHLAVAQQEVADRDARIAELEATDGG